MSHNPILEKVRPEGAEARAAARLNASMSVSSKGGKAGLGAMSSFSGSAQGAPSQLWAEGDPPLTEHQSRMIKRAYEQPTLLEHMYGLGNTECIKKAIELYFRKCVVFAVCRLVHILFTFLLLSFSWRSNWCRCEEHWASSGAARIAAGARSIHLP